MNGITYDMIAQAKQALKNWHNYLINPKKLARISGLTRRQAGSVIQHLNFKPWSDAKMSGSKHYHIPKELRA